MSSHHAQPPSSPPYHPHPLHPSQPPSSPPIPSPHPRQQLLEAFGAGTAVVVCPIKAILYEGKELAVIQDEAATVGPLTRRVWDAITDIQYGRVEHPWSVRID